MINIFRKIRYQLFDDNKARKYFIYALGEILLIVVGILIALQISNWNERNKSARLGDEMVSEIKRGIESDLAELDKFISTHHKVYNGQLVFSKWLGSGGTFVDSLSTYLSMSYRANDYSINYSGYETLKKFGMKRIKDDELRTAISDLYELKYPYFIKFTTIYQGFLDQLLKLNSKHFNELNYMVSNMKPNNPQLLQKDTEYLYHFNSLKNFSQLLIFQGMQMKKEMKEVYGLME